MGEATSCCVSREPIGPIQGNLNAAAIVQQEKELNGQVQIVSQKKSQFRQGTKEHRTRKNTIGSSNSQSRHRRNNSSSSSTKLSDEARILRANKYFDIQEAIDLISSDISISFNRSPSHPWEAYPDTVGSLALCLLIEWSIMGIPDSQRSKVILDCLQNNIISILSQVLDIQQISKTQNALVLLTIILDECAQYIFQDLKQELPTFINLLDNQQEGMRNSACTILRHIMDLDEKSRTQFIIIGGLRKLQRMLNLCQEDNEILLESLQLLRKILSSSDQQIMQYNLKRASELNFDKLIQDLNNFSRPNEIKEELSNIQSLLEQCNQF